MLSVISNVASRAMSASFKVPMASFRSSGSKSSSIRPLSISYGRSSPILRSRALFTSSILRDAAADASDDAKTESPAGPDEMDVSMLQPKAGEVVSAVKSKLRVARVFTAEQSERCAKSMEQWRRKVLRGANAKERERSNASLIEASERGDDLEVLDLWLNSAGWGYTPSTTSLNCVFIALERMEDIKQFPSNMDTAASQIYQYGHTPTLLSYLILMDYYAKIQEYPKSRRYYMSLVEDLERHFEDLQEQHDALTEEGKPIPEHLQPPFYGIHTHYHFESTDQLRKTLEYFVLLISAAEGTVGPLSRRKTLETLIKQCNGTEFGAILSLRDAETLIKEEKQIFDQVLNQ